jgi:DNA-binding PadR family transcriptional regulator
MFRYIVLGLLRDGVARHGYALAKAYAERSGSEVSTSSFYRELQRLTAEGWVRTTENPPGADARRLPYAITGAGKAAFDEWLLHQAELGDGQREDDISARALFLAVSAAPEVGPLLARWQEALWIRGKVIERARDTARTRRRGAEAVGVLPLLLSRRLKYITADLEFLAEFRAAHDAWTPKTATPARTTSDPVTSAAPATPARPKPPRHRG